MTEGGVALARRLYLHAKDGGAVTAMDLSRIVIEMEKLLHERDVALAQCDRLAADLSKAQLDIVPWIKKAGAAKAVGMEEAHAHLSAAVERALENGTSVRKAIQQAKLTGDA